MHRDVDLMDSKVVSQEIERRIWASLKTMGFDMFTSRTAWRHGIDTIDVFNLQSFSKYDADVLGITTFSFRVNLQVLGVHTSAVASEDQGRQAGTRGTPVPLSR